jgi:adenylosuccinate synthase
MKASDLHIVVGGFFGDEGKGKIVSYLSLAERPRAIVRTGATNAGHTVVCCNKKWKLRAIPSGFIYKDARLYIARGALIDKEVFLSEVNELGVKGRVWMDYMTGIITEEHKIREQSDEHFARLGSTRTGVGAAMSDRVLRRLKLARDFPELKEFVTDTQEEILEILEKGEKVLVEATQGYWLSLYHGTYPYVTSRDTTACGALSEIGIGPRAVRRITVVFKAYVTRVGTGPLPGEMSFDEAKKRGIIEYGTVTGRPRRVAPFNLELALKAVKANSATDVAITKIDVLFPEVRCLSSWERLPRNVKNWIEEIEEKLGVPVALIGTGEDVNCIVDRSNEVLNI